jgi:glutathione S-transferase
MFFAAGPLESAVTMKALGFEIPAERLRMAGCGSFGDVMNTLDMAVSGSTYVTGERFTAADVYVGAHIGWGLQFGSIEKRPAFVEYHKHVSDRPAAKRATELDDAAMPNKSA